MADLAALLVGWHRLLQHLARGQLCRQRLVGQLEQRGGEHGVLQGVRNHHGHVLTHVLDREVRQWGPALQWQVVGQLAWRRVQRRAVERGQHGEHAGCRRGLGRTQLERFNGDDAVCDLRLHDDRVRHVGDHGVGRVFRCTGDLLAALHPVD